MVEAEVVMEERESVLAVLERECSERMKISLFSLIDFSKRGNSSLFFLGKNFVSFCFLMSYIG